MVKLEAFSPLWLADLIIDVTHPLDNVIFCSLFWGSAPRPSHLGGTLVVGPHGCMHAPRCVRHHPLYTTRCHRNSKKIFKDNNHPSHCLFTPLSSRRRSKYRCIKAGTELLSQGHPTVKQPPLTLIGCCQHTDSSLATLIMTN